MLSSPCIFVRLIKSQRRIRRLIFSTLALCSEGVLGAPSNHVTLLDCCRNSLAPICLKESPETFVGKLHCKVIFGIPPDFAIK